MKRQTAGDYIYVPKRRSSKRQSNKEAWGLPAEPMTGKALFRPPIAYPEGGNDTTILPADAVTVDNTNKQWVDKLFEPLTTPNDALGSISTHKIMPTTLG